MEKEMVIVDAGVDYFYGIGVGGDFCDALMALFREHVESQDVIDNKVSEGGDQECRTYYCNGMKVWVDESTAGKVRMPGACAELSRKLNRHASLGVKRIDYQVTVRLPEANPDLARVLRDELMENGTGQGQRATVTLIMGDPGDTLYVGKRENARCVRVYDKGAQAGTEDVGRLWRYEVEYKQKVAPLMYERWVASLGDPTYVRDVLQGYLQARRIVPADYLSSAPIRVQFHQAPSTLNARASWLAKQVRPALDVFRKEGKLSMVYDLLELDPPDKEN